MPTHGPTSEGRLTAVLDRFEEVWRTGDAPPTLGEFLMVGDDSAETRRQLLIELIKIDLEYRWQQPDHGVATAADAPFPRRARLEDYVQQYPELGPIADLPLDLICEEFRVRQQWGDRPQTAEYLERFPGQQASLDRRLPRLQAELLAVQGRRRLQELPRSERFIIQQRLGSGGMGVVYLAFDCERKQQVALKTMQEVDPAALYRFKQEFRALADVAHPHLVSLYELFAEGDQWFFSMELVEGVPFLDYVRGRSPQHDPSESPTDPNRSLSRSTLREAVQGLSSQDSRATSSSESHAQGLDPEEESRLRSAMRQLAEALAFVHQAGVLHRDVKPSNVLVTPAGQLKLLDFGLAVTTEPDALLSQATRPQFAGTAAYMSPEQAASQPLTPASDWYSLGVMLYEALTGQLPFTGSSLDILLAKRTSTPVPPEQLLPGLPKDLCALCTQLLAPEPTARPSGEDVLKKLACDPQKITVTSADSASPQLVGRESHLQSLQDSLQSLLAGETVLVQVSGHSGAGKSTLVQRFLEDTHDRHRAVILTGRCYEQESVPFKALDDLIDSLSRYLNRLSHAEVEAILPRDVVPLVRVFPVLQRVKIIADAPRPAVEIPDPQELRQRAFGALRDLLARLGDRHTLVLFIDDVQWGDLDSARLLSTILRPPGPPRLMLVTSYRSEDIAGSPFLQFLQDGTALEGVRQQFISVEALTPDETKQLARRLLGTTTVPEEQLRIVASESGGNPFFLQELADHFRGKTGDMQSTDARAIGLEDVLWNRIAQLSGAAQQLLHIIAISGRPLPEGVAWSAAQVNPDGRLLNDLRHQRLLRTVPLAKETTWDTYHDRLRETVLARLPNAEIEDYHRRLATVLERLGAAPDAIAAHFEKAREFTKAADYYVGAARHADATLAFDRSAFLYRRALAIGDFAGSPHFELRLRLADALANGGRGDEAATQYLDIARSWGEASLALKQKAAQQLLISGRYIEGDSVLREVIANVGMKYPRSSTHAFWTIVFRQCLQALGIPQIRLRSKLDNRHELLRLDICWSAVMGFGLTDPIVSAYFQTEHLRLALRTGDPFRLARALAFEAGHLAALGTPAARRVFILLQQADELARVSENVDAIAEAKVVRALATGLLGDWKTSVDLCDRADEFLRTHCVGLNWELDAVHRFALWGHSYMGNLAEVAKRLPLLRKEAHDRNNLFALRNVSTIARSALFLADDDPASARRALAESIIQTGTYVDQCNATLDSTDIDLYCGMNESAFQRITREWPLAKKSYVLRVQQIRVFMLNARGRTALALATSNRDRKEMIRQAIHDAKCLSKENAGWASAFATSLWAGIEFAKGNGDHALELLQHAIIAFDKTQMEHYREAARLQLGLLTGGATGREMVAHAEMSMAKQGIRDPKRTMIMRIPGFVGKG